MGKFYDAAKTRTYCDGINDEFDTYSQAAGVQNDTFSDFSANTEWRGEDAVAGKELIGNFEAGNLSSILTLQADVKNLQGNIIDKFSYEVDSASDALVKYDILKRINRDFQNLYMDYDNLGRIVETMADELNAKFGRYGSFFKPDFMTGRNSFRDICGAGNDDAGFFKECMNRLSKYDAETTAMIQESGILEKIQDLAELIDNSSNAIAVMPLSAKTDIDTSIVSGISLSSVACALDKENVTFDDEGAYGASQGDMYYNMSGIDVFGKWIWFENEGLYDFVRSHKGYEHATSQTIYKLFKQINCEGCGYAAMTNAILTEYDGKEKEFEKTFGFPMYNDKGDLNYDKLLVDIYLSTDDKIWMQEPDGTDAMFSEVMQKNNYDKDPDAFKAKYGIDLYMNGDASTGYYSLGVYGAVLKPYLNSKMVTMKTDGVNAYVYNNRLSHYLSEHGVACDNTMEYNSDGTALSVKKVNSYINDGKIVQVACDNFMLYDENGKAIQKEKISAHWMTITGTTDDGEYIVSSWGRKYYLKPSELSEPYYEITSISKEREADK